MASSHLLQRFSLVALATTIQMLAILPLLAIGELVVENYPDGSLKAKYNVVGGKKNGKYEDFHENGKPKTRANYRDDLLTGSFMSFHENGVAHIASAYKKGQLHGKCSEKTPKGLLVDVSEFADDVRHGKQTRYVDGKASVRCEYRHGDLVGIEGVITHARTRQEIAKDLGKIYATRYVYEPKSPPDPKAAAPKPAPKDFPTEDHLAAVQRLNAYRNLCGIAADVMLDGEQTYYAQAGSKLLKQHGTLSHTPPNPGMPEDEYQDGYIGTSRSNIYQGRSIMSKTVDGYMDDSDEANIDRVGHRRWCLNVGQLTTGFGSTDKFSAMWSFDNRRRQVASWTFIPYPASGYMPMEYFSARHAWSISLNKSLFQVPTSDTKARIFPLDDDFKRGEPLPFDYEKYDVQSGMGSGHAVIFRPSNLDMSAGKRYLVELSGLQNRERKPTSVRYLVEFANIEPIPPAGKK